MSYNSSFALRYSFVNEKFQNVITQIDETVMELSVLLENNESDDPTDFYSIKSNKTKDELDAILNLLKTAKYSTVEFQFKNFYDTRTEFNKGLLENFAYFCRKLEDIETLKNIYVDFDLATGFKISRPTAFAFSSLLPKNKSIYMNTAYDMSSILQMHENPVEVLIIDVLNFDKCTAQIFKSNTKELFFNDAYLSMATVLKLHYLRVIGPFSPNPSLKCLGIGVDLMFSKLGSNIINRELEKIEKYLWDKEFLPDYRKAFEYLRQVNDELELELKTNETENVNDKQSCFSFHNEQLQRAKSIIDMAQEFGFKIKDFHIKTIFMLQFVPKTQMAEEFIKSTKMKVAEEGDENEEDINLIQYNSVPINLKILFRRPFRFSCIQRTPSF